MIKTLLTLVFGGIVLKYTWKFIKYTIEVLLMVIIFGVAILNSNTDTRTSEDIEIENSIRETVNEFIYECSLDSIK